MTNPDPASAVASAAIAAAAAGPLSKLVKIVIIVMIIYFPPDLNPSNHDHYLKIIKTQCEWSSRSRSLWSGILFSRTLIFVCRLFTSPPPPSSSTSSHHIKVTERSIWPGVSSHYDICNSRFTVHSCHRNKIYLLTLIIFLVTISKSLFTGGWLPNRLDEFHHSFTAPNNLLLSVSSHLFIITTTSTNSATPPATSWAASSVWLLRTTSSSCSSSL